MELFDNIEQFKPEYLFNKFDIDKLGYLSLNQTKHCLLFAFGIEISLSQLKILLQLDVTNDIEGNLIPVEYNQFVFLYKALYNEYISNKTVISSIVNSDTGISFLQFQRKSTLYYPNLNPNFIESIFVELDSDKDGYISKDDLETFLLNNNSI